MNNISIKKKIEEVENDMQEIEKEMDLEFEPSITPIEYMLNWLESVKSDSVSLQSVKDMAYSLVEKEKQEIKDAYTAGFLYSNSEYNGDVVAWMILNEYDEDDFEEVSEEYYQRTYKNK